MNLQQPLILNSNKLLNSKYQNNNKNNQKTNHSNIAFGGALDGAATSFLNFLQTNQAIGASLVDVSCMGIPRTTVDFQRSPQAGIETARREFSSTINDTALGFYGMVAAYFLGKGLNNKFGGIEANGLFISNDMVDILSQTWCDTIKEAKGSADKDKVAENFLRKIYGNALAYKPKSEDASLEKNFVNINNETINEIIKENLTEVASSKKVKMNNESFAKIKNLIMESTGVEDRYYLENKNILVETKVKGKKVTTYGKKCELTLDELIQNTNKMLKMFKNDNVAATFQKGIKATESSFVKGLKTLTKKTSIVGIGASMLVGLSVQPINAYLTKKKTGKSGFVGGGGEDNSTGFKILKTGIAITACLGALATITRSPSKLLEKIQFKSIWPTLDQFKFLYGATIISRILSARNDNELRETTFKDSLGFANWLIFGGIVSKLTAKAFEHFTPHQYIKYNKAQDGAGKLNWIQKCAIMSRNEVLIPAMKKLGLSTIKDGKALSIKQIIKVLKAEAKKGTPIAKEALSKNRNLGIIQFAGYLYSGLVLGFCIPKLNIAMTKHFENKKHKHDAQNVNNQIKK